MCEGARHEGVAYRLGELPIIRALVEKTLLTSWFLNPLIGTIKRRRGNIIHYISAIVISNIMSNGLWCDF